MSETRDDGTVVTYKWPSAYTKSLPTYKEWEAFLASRGFGDGSTNTVVRSGSKSRRHRAELTGQHASFDYDTEVVSVICICCGLLQPRTETAEIVVGTVVQQYYEESTGLKEVTVGKRPMPVSKKGYGCKACQDLYHGEVFKIARENATRQAIATEQSKIAVIEAKMLWLQLTAEERVKAVRMGKADPTKVKPVKLPNMLTAFVDVFPKDEGI